jgi:hypothetical protein
MTTQSNLVLDAALQLAPKERAEVVAKLLTSLDAEADPNAEALWAVEIERRARRVLAGEGQFEDWAQIRDQLRPRS